MIRWTTLLLVLGLASPLHAAQFERLSRSPLPRGEADLGGLSGVVVSPDGASVTMITDRGKFVSATLSRDAGRVVTGVDNLALHPILSTLGKPLSKYDTDSEGLTRARDGGLIVSFETENAVLYAPAIGAHSRPRPLNADIRALGLNKGLEALATLPDGRVLAIPEEPSDQGFPVWRFDAPGWTVLGHIAPMGDFRVTGADVGPDGRLYVLERSFRFLAGFGVRIRAFDVSETGLSGEEVLYAPKVTRYANFEGISLWRTSDGAIRAVLVSDDNFKGILESVVEELELRDTPVIE